MDANNYDGIADLYDTYVPATYDLNFFIKETGKISGEVLELMSGTGRVSIPLLEAGIKLTCVDLSGELNTILGKKLKQKGLKADIYKMDICELDIPNKFDMIIIPFHSFAHIVSPDDQRKALLHIHQHLLPGGKFICTLANPALRKNSVDGQLHFFRKYPLENRSGCLLLWIRENFNPVDNQIVEAIEFFEEYDAQGILKSKRLMELHFRLTTRDEFEKMASAAAFKVKSFFGDYTYADFNREDSPFMIWIFEKVG